MTIGERIKKRRLELDLSVEDLANKLHKNRATIYRYESNEIEKMPVGVIEQIAIALKTTPAYLMGWEDAGKDTMNEDSSECDIKTIAAHVDGEPLTEEEIEEVLEFARFQLLKRKNKEKK